MTTKQLILANPPEPVLHGFAVPCWACATEFRISGRVFDATDNVHQAYDEACEYFSAMIAEYDARQLAGLRTDYDLLRVEVTECRC